jgi:protein-disulfide isomerase
MKRFVLAAVALLSTLPLVAQMAVPANGASTFKDTSTFKPPAGVKLAIIEFEDLECYACAQASPLVRAAMSQYNIPRIHHDYIIPSHIWSRTAAITARYLEDKVSPKIAEDYRRDVFANQSKIASRDDLAAFTRTWFQSHGQQMPFVLDPSGRCADEVQADCMLAARLGIPHTPTIIVVTPQKWIEVTDPRQIFAAIDIAKASLKETPSTHRSKQN